MSNNDDWLNETYNEDNEDPKSLKELEEEEEARRKKVKRSRPGQPGRPPIQGIERELVDRAGKKGPLVMIFGQGPRSGNKQVSVAVSKKLAAKLDKYTTGSRAQVLPLLAEWALEELESQGKCISATAIK